MSVTFTQRIYKERKYYTTAHILWCSLINQ